MNFSVYTLTLVLFMSGLCVDLLAFFFGQPLAGVTLTTSTLVVFFIAHVWVVHHPEKRIRLKSPWLAIPVFLINVGFVLALAKSDVNSGFPPEDLLAQGQIIMSRLQGTLWILGLIMLCAFVLVANLLKKGRA